MESNILQNDLNNNANSIGFEPKVSKHRMPFLNGVPMHESKASNNLSSLEKFLEDEKNKNNGNDPWSKLDKTAKTKKILAFADIYKEEKKLATDEYTKLITFLRDCLDRKKLQRVKDVVYDKTTGQIKDIPALAHNKSTNHFTLKNIDKRVSTLKSLGPKKVRTIKNVTNEDIDSEDEA